MQFVIDYPFRVFSLSLIVMCVVTLGFHLFFKRTRALNKSLHDTFSLTQGATFTFLVFLIGFSFSIATGNHNNRQKHESAEANAINVAYMRFDFLPENIKLEAQKKLIDHLNLRLAYYHSKSLEEKTKINQDINQIDNDLWGIIKTAALNQPNMLIPLVVTSVNDLTESAAYIHISELERIHHAIWYLIFILAVFSCILNSYGAIHNANGIKLTLIFPVILAFSLMLLSDLDSTLGGFIYIDPIYLNDLAWHYR